MKISELNPQLVWQYFEQITQVPRESKHEEQIIEFMLDFAKKHNLKAKKDEAGNVLIKKGASKGMENVQSVCFQAHLDMVCTANKDVKINFATDPIPAYIDGEYVKSKGTSLGADDGIGVAMCMMLLTDETIKHGPIECLFTVDEETGLTGAFALQKNFFDSKLLINLDSEEEGKIYIGCAGGIDVKAKFEYFVENVPKDSIAFKFIINGLKGGHSGDEIHKGLGNANKIANRFLSIITQKYNVRLSEFDGGDRHNAIPRFADFIFTVKKQHENELKAEFEKFVEDIKKEFIKLENEINIELKSVDLPEFVIDIDTQEQFINALYICPHGVYAMSLDVNGLVETSNNLAVVKFRDENGELFEGNNAEEADEEDSDNWTNDDNENWDNEDDDDDDDDEDWDDDDEDEDEDWDDDDEDWDDDDDDDYDEDEWEDVECDCDNCKKSNNDIKNYFEKRLLNANYLEEESSNYFDTLNTRVIEVVTSQRSSSESGKRDINTMVRKTFESNFAACTSGDGYPGWKPNPDSALLKITVDAYQKLFGKMPEVKAIHAGLECGLFLEKYPDLDMVSFGPTLAGVHSPDEKIEIKTVEMWYKHILEILENIPKK